MADDGVEDEDEGKGYFNIKCGLQKFFKAQLTERQREIATRRIDEFVMRLSALAVEASRMIHFDLYQKLDDSDLGIFTEEAGLDFFYHHFKALTVNQYRSIGAPDYFDYREEVGDISLCTNDRLGNAHNNLARLFRTNFANNIWMHARKRIKKFLKIKHPRASKVELNRSIHRLFNERRNWCQIRRRNRCQRWV